MAQKVHITTPENVLLEYEIAGLGTRGIALLIDTLIQFLTVVALAGLYPAFMSPGGREQALGPAVRVLQSGWATALFMIALYTAYQGYFLVFEAASRGQTPGKRMAGIRVIMDDGRSLTFRGAILRNVLRLADFLPVAYFAGTVAAFSNGYSKRIGDLSAGTVVVKVRRSRTDIPLAVQLSGGQAARTLGIESQQLAAGMSSRQIQAIRRLLDRSVPLPADVREHLSGRIARQVASHLAIECPQTPAGKEALLREVLDIWDSRRRP